ncbi:MAG: MBL fold metallo-hydrolase, partial [Oscillospiraceae bacterium]
VHGENEVTETYAQSLRERGFSAHAPLFEEVYDLLDGTVLSPGVVLAQKPSRSTPAASPTYHRLEDVGRKLQDVIRKNKGTANKDLAKLADQLAALLDKWDK